MVLIFSNSSVDSFWIILGSTVVTFIPVNGNDLPQVFCIPLHCNHEITYVLIPFRYLCFGGLNGLFSKVLVISMALNLSSVEFDLNILHSNITAYHTVWAFTMERRLNSVHGVMTSSGQSRGVLALTDFIGSYNIYYRFPL